MKKDQTRLSRNVTHQLMVDAVSSVLPNSCFMQVACAMKEINNPSQAPAVNMVSTYTKKIAASHLKMENLVKAYKCHESDGESEVNAKIKLFVDSMPKLSSMEVAEVEQATVSQSDSTDWFDFRKGRTTASKFYAVHTKVQSIKRAQLKGDVVNVDNLLCTSMNYKPLSDDIPSLKHGKQMENEAKAYYNDKTKKEHTDFEVRDCWLFRDKDKSYLGATPDQLVQCKCCGEGLLEIKSPYSIRHTKPAPENLDFLTIDKETNQYKLKNNHSYYAQVQEQMAITQRKWCDFLVYTAHGYYIERIVFSEVYWLDICESLDYFWINYLSYELVTKKLLKTVVQV